LEVDVIISKEITFCTTAMCRPRVLDRCYSSFYANLKGLQLRTVKLLINIDPLPNVNDRKKVIDVAKKYFGEVCINLPDKPNFTRAVNWLWSVADTPYIFHLEDDWELIKPIYFNDIITQFDKHPNLYQVVLRAYEYQYQEIALSPSCIAQTFYSVWGGKLDETLNPEVQLHKKMGLRTMNQTHVIAIPKKIIVKDIGRKFLKKICFKKPDIKSKFVSWVKK